MRKVMIRYVFTAPLAALAPVLLIVSGERGRVLPPRTDSGPSTYHRSALQTSFLAPDAGHTADQDGAAYTATTGSWYYLTGVDVLGARAAGRVVALGDSITDGSGSTASANHRRPDRLSARLRELPPARAPQRAERRHRGQPRAAGRHRPQRPVPAGHRRALPQRRARLDRHGGHQRHQGQPRPDRSRRHDAGLQAMADAIDLHSFIGKDMR
ncbi:hypothetical protein AB0D57_45290 [Streptomyces sp. NPDC048275]|uniref:hypothetical protein n=1 Tax=Streptomyces sp. NPDC048275 TaxID=3155629 RepID=UPI0034116389